MLIAIQNLIAYICPNQLLFLRQDWQKLKRAFKT